MKDMKQLFSQNIAKINVKTSTFLEENKIKAYIATLENEIAEKKRQLADIACDQWREGRAISQEELEPVLEEIMGREMLILEQKQKMDEIVMEQKKIFGTAAAESAATVAAPTASAAPTTAAEPIVQVVYCAMCGTQNQESARFCRHCGANLKE